MLKNNSQKMRQPSTNSSNNYHKINTCNVNSVDCLTSSIQPLTDLQEKKRNANIAPVEPNVFSQKYIDRLKVTNFTSSSDICSDSFFKTSSDKSADAIYNNNKNISNNRTIASEVNDSPTDKKQQSSGICNNMPTTNNFENDKKSNTTSSSVSINSTMMNGNFIGSTPLKSLNFPNEINSCIVSKANRKLNTTTVATATINLDKLNTRNSNNMNRIIDCNNNNKNVAVFESENFERDLIYGHKSSNNIIDQKNINNKLNSAKDNATKDSDTSEPGKNMGLLFKCSSEHQVHRSSDSDQAGGKVFNATEKNKANEYSESKQNPLRRCRKNSFDIRKEPYCQNSSTDAIDNNTSFDYKNNNSNKEYLNDKENKRLLSNRKIRQDYEQHHQIGDSDLNNKSVGIINQNNQYQYRYNDKIKKENNCSNETSQSDSQIQQQQLNHDIVEKKFIQNLYKKHMKNNFEPDSSNDMVDTKTTLSECENYNIIESTKNSDFVPFLNLPGIQSTSVNGYESNIDYNLQSNAIERNKPINKEIINLFDKKSKEFDRFSSQFERFTPHKNNYYACPAPPVNVDYNQHSPLSYDNPNHKSSHTYNQHIDHPNHQNYFSNNLHYTDNFYYRQQQQSRFNHNYQNINSEWSNNFKRNDFPQSNMMYRHATNYLNECDSPMAAGQRNNYSEYYENRYMHPTSNNVYQKQFDFKDRQLKNVMEPFPAGSPYLNAVYSNSPNPKNYLGDNYRDVNGQMTNQNMMLVNNGNYYNDQKRRPNYSSECNENVDTNHNNYIFSSSLEFMPNSGDKYHHTDKENQMIKTEFKKQVRFDSRDDTHKSSSVGSGKSEWNTMKNQINTLEENYLESLVKSYKDHSDAPNKPSSIKRNPNFNDNNYRPSYFKDGKQNRQQKTTMHNNLNNRETLKIADWLKREQKLSTTCIYPSSDTINDNSTNHSINHTKEKKNILKKMFSKFIKKPRLDESKTSSSSKIKRSTSFGGSSSDRLSLKKSNSLRNRRNNRNLNQSSIKDNSSVSNKNKSLSLNKSKSCINQGYKTIPLIFVVGRDEPPFKTEINYINVINLKLIKQLLPKSYDRGGLRYFFMQENDVEGSILVEAFDNDYLVPIYCDTVLCKLEYF